MLERRAGIEPANTGFADLRVCHFATGARSTGSAVSYTHLDVYKRQLLAGLMAVSGGGSRLWTDDPAKFDLVGPKVDVRVQRGSVTLPIAQVPNLMAEDKIWVKVDLPSTQSNHCLLYTSRCV